MEEEKEVLNNKFKDCNCLKGAKSNTSDLFIRKISQKNPKELKERHFKPNSEKSNALERIDIDDCESVCGNHGVSVDIFTKASSATLLKKYKTTNSFAPRLKDYLAVVRFTVNAGQLKHTPNQAGGYNKYHYDFYRSDPFDIKNIHLEELIHIASL